MTTRKELERALVETAWGFYHKGEKVQYCGRPFNDTFPKWYGGAHRPPAYSTLEDATSQKSLFTVCSDFCYSVYDNALKMPLLGGRLNYTTGAAWRCSAAPKEFAVIRWVSSAYNDGAGTYTQQERELGISQKPATLDELLAFLADWKKNLRPGDIFDVLSGPGGAHNLLYIGGGYILDSVGKSYDASAGLEKREEKGSVRTLRTVEDMFVNEDSKWNVRSYEANGTPSFFCVLRPLDLIVKDDVLDPDYVMPNAGPFHHDPNLPRTGFHITDAAAARVKYPGIEIDRTADIAPYASCAAGQMLTYSVQISNKSTSEAYCKFRTDVDDVPYSGEDHKSVFVQETVPQGTELVSASHGASVSGRNIHWTADIPKGESVTVSYSVKVTAKRGDCIVSGGGFVAGIPSTVLCNSVGGAKLPTESLRELSIFADAGTARWNSNDGYKISANACDTAFAGKIYQQCLGLDFHLPRAQQILDELFCVKELNFPYGFGETFDRPLHTWLYALKDDVSPEFEKIRSMVIRGYLGGKYVYTDKFGGEPRINEFRLDDLEPGDIVIHGNLSPYCESCKERTVTETNVIVCLAEGKYASLNSGGEMFFLEGDRALWKAYVHDFFVGLRPTQAYDDISKAVPAYDRTKTPLLTDADANRALDPWSGESMKRCFARIAPDTWQMARFPINQRAFATWVYSVAGLDIAEKMAKNIDEGPDSAGLMLLEESEPLLIGDLLCLYKKVEDKKRFASAVKIDDTRFFYATGLAGVGHTNECYFLSETEVRQRMHELTWDVFSALRPSRAY